MGIKRLEYHSTGCHLPAWNWLINAQRPTSLALVVTRVERPGEKCTRLAAFKRAVLIAWNEACCSGPHTQGTSLASRSINGHDRWASQGIKLLKSLPIRETIAQTSGHGGPGTGRWQVGSSSAGQHQTHSHGSQGSPSWRQTDYISLGSLTGQPCVDTTSLAAGAPPWNR